MNHPQSASRLLLGPNSVREAILANPRRIDAVFVRHDARTKEGPLRACAELAKNRGLTVAEKTDAELTKIALHDRHQGIVAIAGEYVYAEIHEVLDACDASETSLLVALDEITDPHNFGAIVRSAVAFGAKGIFTLKDRAAPITGAVVRASAGTTEVARIVRVTNLSRTLEELKTEGFEAIGLAGEASIDLGDLPRTSRRVLVIGSEGKGIRPLVRKHCDALVRIPMSGQAESLNASVAAAIAMYAMTQA